MNTLYRYWQTFRLPILCCGFALGLLAIRLAYTGQWTFIFLAWNLFLAGIPWLISQGIHRRRQHPLVLGLWLLFFPNAPYILTDLFHLRARSGVPIWYDLTLLIAFAWAGLFLGLQSLRQVQEAVFDRWGQIWSWLITAGVWLLTAYGVYLGRFLRWNSWDLLTRPGQLLSDVIAPLLAPQQHVHAIGFTLCFGALLLLGYYAYRGHAPAAPAVRSAST
ncbi:MAG: DUF1361 domain-containing protein [Bacteroidetes bacterium]|nr:MAG: DUF1361 domain-containing protein [Bacteroidota bacterium]